jgi:hypothetical protein
VCFGIRPLPTRRLVEGIWITAGFVMLGLGLASAFVVAVKLALGRPRVRPDAVMFLVCALTTVTWWSSTLRERAQSLLLSGGEPVAIAAGTPSVRERSSAIAVKLEPGMRTARFIADAQSHGRSQSIFTALAWLWVRAYALALLTIAFLSAHVLAPALADCVAP